MSLIFDGLRCPRLEDSLKKGAKLGIFRSGDTSLLSRLHNNTSGLISSEVSDSLVVLLEKTDWQLIPDKMGASMPFYRSTQKSALEQLVARGYYLAFDAKYDVLRGYIIDPNKNIIKIRKNLKDLSTLLQLMELEAIKLI